MAVDQVEVVLIQLDDDAVSIVCKCRRTNLKTASYANRARAILLLLLLLLLPLPPPPPPPKSFRSGIGIRGE